MKNIRNHVLFVCTANVDRSRTAMDFFSEQFSDTRFSSAGTDEELTKKAGTQFLTQVLLDAADHILVMEDKHRQWIEANRNVTPDQIHVLHIPDNYRYYSMDLIELLQQKCAPFF